MYLLPNFDLIETKDILCVDIIPDGPPGFDPLTTEMTTIYVLLNDKRIDYFPKIGPYRRSEDHALYLIT